MYRPTVTLIAFLYESLRHHIYLEKIASQLGRDHNSTSYDSYSYVNDGKELSFLMQVSKVSQLFSLPFSLDHVVSKACTLGALAQLHIKRQAKQHRRGE